LRRNIKKVRSKEFLKERWKSMKKNINEYSSDTRSNEETEN